MIKRVLIGGAVLALLGAFFFGRDATSHLRTSVGMARNAVQESIPVEYQVDRARRMIAELAPEIRRNMHLIAREEVEVEGLAERIAQTEARLEKEKSDILRLQGDLAGGGDTFRYAGRSYSSEQVQVDLTNRFERYKTGEATLASLREIYQARERSLHAARQKLDGMMAAKRQLEVDVENIQARLQMVAAAQTTNNFHFDDSRLGRVRELVADLRARVDVAERLVHAEDHFHDEIPLDKPSPDSIVEQITAYFGTAEVDSRSLAQH